MLRLFELIVLLFSWSFWDVLLILSRLCVCMCVCPHTVYEFCGKKFKLKWMNEIVDTFITAVLVHLRAKVLHLHTHYVQWTIQIFWCQAVVFYRFHYRPSHCQQKIQQQRMSMVCKLQISIKNYFFFYFLLYLSDTTVRILIMQL